jgi:transposase
MTYFLGCDVSKRKIDVSLVDERGVELLVDKVPNTPDDIANLLLTLSGNYPEVEIRCVVESTACFHHPVTEAATAVGMGCLVLNPIITKQQIRATIRGKKTDRTDALIIARLGLRGEGLLYTPEPYLAAKYLARSQQKLSQLAGSFKRHETHLTELLESELSPKALAALEQVQEALRLAKHQLALDTVAAAPKELMKLLQSIPGVGPYVASSLIGEVQTMKRFKSPKALIAYVGLDPRIRQSGHTLNSTGKLTKRGSSYLRRSLFIAASVARQHDPNLKALYDQKRSEGKSYTVAVCVVARKLLKVIRAIWLNGNSYNPEMLHENSLLVATP